MERKLDGADGGAPLAVTERRLLARKHVNAMDDYANADRTARQRQAEAEAEYQRRMAARDAPASVLKSMRDDRLQQSTARVVRQEALGYSQQAALVARTLRIAPDQRVELDTRIDIVRAIWQRQMRRAHRALDTFDRATDFAGATR